MVNTFHSAQEAIQWIESLVSHGMKPGLQRMEWFMQRFDRPERKLKWIHVAGTNGKGSTCAFLRSLLRTNGYDVGMFTSPYITRFQQRIEYNGQAIPDESLVRFANVLFPLVQELSETELGSPTMFEVVTTIAILYFATEAYPDYVVWETGMGGRLDSTNVVVPILSIITTVDMDHMEFLGDTIEKIAAEKAGIIKNGVPVVCGKMDDAALQVMRETAKTRKSTLYAFGEHFQAIEADKTEKDHQLTIQYTGPFGAYPELTLGLSGTFQLYNAATALMAMDVLRQYLALIVEPETVAIAMREVNWPGRCEWLDTKQCFLVDGAHNAQGAKALAESLDSWGYQNQVIFLIGMSASKDPFGVLQPLLPFAQKVVFTSPEFRQAMSHQRLSEAIEQVKQTNQLKFETTYIPDWKQAIEHWQTIVAEQKGIGVACGSLYWIADVRSWFFYQKSAEKGW